MTFSKNSFTVESDWMISLYRELEVLYDALPVDSKDPGGDADR